MSYLATDKPVTLHELGVKYGASEKIATLTAYDASFAALVDRCGKGLRGQRSPWRRR